MTLSAFGGQLYSISFSGQSLFQQETPLVLAGGVILDLVSAPIEPGEYRLELHTGVGGVEIFLPHYAQCTIDGGSAIGGKDFHEGPQTWKHIRKKLHGKVNLPEQVPDFALASHESRPVTIHLTLKTGVGGVDIYRL